MVYYCEIILIHWGQCAWIVEYLLVCGDVSSWVTGLLNYNARQSITLLNICWEVNSWVRVTHGIHIKPPQSMMIPQYYKNTGHCTYIELYGHFNNLLTEVFLLN